MPFFECAVGRWLLAFSGFKQCSDMLAWLQIECRQRRVDRSARLQIAFHQHQLAGEI